MRRVIGDLHLEARPGGRAIVVLAAATGERVAIERSPDQLRQLRDSIDQLLQPPEERAPAPADPPPPSPPAKSGRRARAAEPVT